VTTRPSEDPTELGALCFFPCDPFKVLHHHRNREKWGGRSPLSLENVLARNAQADQVIMVFSDRTAQGFAVGECRAPREIPQVVIGQVGPEARSSAIAWCTAMCIVC
jgi:hypothetical protein